MNVRRIDVITPLFGRHDTLALTIRSLEELAVQFGVGVRWIVVERPDADRKSYNESIYRGGLITLVHERGPWRQYEAINVGLSLVRSSHFMILNDGDVVLPSGLLRMLSRAHDERDVLCGLTMWHNHTGAQVDYESRRVRPYLGILPNHQGMLFPLAVAKLRYREDLPIAGDQDLKLRLWKQGALKFAGIRVVSSLIGGRSMKRLSFHEVYSRYCESRTVFRSHFAPVHAETLGALYAVNFVRRKVFPAAT